MESKATTRLSWPGNTLRALTEGEQDVPVAQPRPLTLHSDESANDFADGQTLKLSPAGNDHFYQKAQRALNVLANRALAETPQLNLLKEQIGRTNPGRSESDVTDYAQAYLVKLYLQISRKEITDAHEGQDTWGQQTLALLEATVLARMRFVETRQLGQQEPVTLNAATDRENDVNFGRLLGLQLRAYLVDNKVSSSIDKGCVGKRPEERNAVRDTVIVDMVLGILNGSASRETNGGFEMRVEDKAFVMKFCGAMREMLIEATRFTDIVNSYCKVYPEARRDDVRVIAAIHLTREVLKEVREGLWDKLEV